MRAILTTVTGALTASLLATSAAQAGGPPVRLQIGTDVPDTPYSLDGPADVATFKVKLGAGSDYAVGFSSQEGSTAEVFDPAGRRLRSAQGFFENENSTEVHARTTGVYTIRISEPGFEGHDGGGVWVYPDCRGGPGTRCTIAAGKTREAVIAGADDGDGFNLKARPGVNYVAELATRDASLLYFQLVDARGRQLAAQFTGRGPYRRGRAKLRFRLPASGGPYFLKVSGTGASHRGRGHYTVSLSRAG